MKDAHIVFALIGKMLMEISSNPDEYAYIKIKKVYQDLMHNKDRFKVFVAKADSEDLVGFISCIETFAFYTNGNYGLINEIYVEPEYRSQGIGKMLLEKVKKFGREQGWSRVDFIIPGDDESSKITNFYEREGFKYFGTTLIYRLDI
jgi:GNAT superfamily N-acetyltransferase